MPRFLNALPRAILPAVMLATAACTAPSDELVVYSSRQEQLVKPFLDKFSEQTGISVKLVTDDAGKLIQRLRAEGDNSPASVLLTVDAGNLWFAADQGLLQPAESDALNDAVPAYLRDPAGQWFGLSVRARTLVYSTERVDPATLVGYADLAGPAWQGRLCLRTSKKVYNQSLVAMMIAELGEARTEEIVRGWVSNLATDPFSNDTRLVEAIAAGQCDVGVVNTYYLGRLLRDDSDLPVGLFWADQDGNGTHVNISGGGITRHAPDAAAARRLLEWLAGDDAQADFAAVNLEFPVATDAALDPIVEGWGPFRQNATNVSQAGALQADAVKLMDRAGYR